jgi:hypothetical protein
MGFYGMIIQKIVKVFSEIMNIACINFAILFKGGTKRDYRPEEKQRKSIYVTWNTIKR